MRIKCCWILLPVSVNSAGSPELSDISPVANFSNLYRLILTDCGVIDVSPIAGLNNLKELWLEGNPITDYSPLRDIYPNLEDKEPAVTNLGEVHICV